MRDPRPNLALLYAAVFAHMGIVLPFLAPWLRLQGLGAAAIGMLLALPPLFKTIAPWCWGLWADRSGKRHELLLAATLLSGGALAALVLAPGPIVLLLLIALYGFTRAPILPYLEATSLEQSERLRFAYGPIRLWGSLAFIASSSGYGMLQARIFEDAGLLIAGGMLLACAGIVPFLPRPLSAASVAGADELTGGAPSAPPRVAERSEPRNIVRFFLACALMQVSHGAYYSFFSIYLEDAGYSGGAIGSLWALAVLCEVLLLTRMDRVVERFGSDRVLQICLIVAAARWWLIGSTTAVPWLALAQVLHAATYAAFHVAAIRLVYRHFGRRRRVRGQALYSGMTYGLGLFAGSLAAGWLVGWLGLPTVFKLSALTAVVALPLLGRRGILQHPRRGSGG